MVTSGPACTNLSRLGFKFQVSTEIRDAEAWESKLSCRLLHADGWFESPNKINKIQHTDGQSATRKYFMWGLKHNT
jgi:hypothetical protein